MDQPFGQAAGKLANHESLPELDGARELAMRRFADLEVPLAELTLCAKGDIHGIPRQHGFGCGAQLLSPFMEEIMERRLAAILVADVVGYSRLMDEDETPWSSIRLRWDG